LIIIGSSKLLLVIFWIFDKPSFHLFVNLVVWSQNEQKIWHFSFNNSKLNLLSKYSSVQIALNWWIAFNLVFEPSCIDFIYWVFLPIPFANLRKKFKDWTTNKNWIFYHFKWLCLGNNQMTIENHQWHAENNKKVSHPLNSPFTDVHIVYECHV